MKKILFTLAALFIMALSANAQVYVGGSLGLHNDKQDFNLAFSPEIGYTFQGNTGVGCLFEFVFDDNNDTGLNTTGFGVNPYFEYRFLEIDKFTFYVHTYLHYARAKVYNNYVSGAASSYGVSLHPGVIWGVTDHWSVAFYFGGVEYLWTKPDGVEFKDGSGDFNLGLATGVPASLALYYAF